MAFALAILAKRLSAQDWAKARLRNLRVWRVGQYKSGDRTIKAFVVYPERKDKAPLSW